MTTPAGRAASSCGCGMPQRDVRRPEVTPESQTPLAAQPNRHSTEQARIPAGTFFMGDSSGDRNLPDGEVPRHYVWLDAFEIDATTVTNDDFARFVTATGDETEAERVGDSAVFHLAVDAPDSDVMSRGIRTPWWWGVRGADWAHPGGRNSALEGLGDHPVVHISWNDAQAYCA